MDILDLNKDVKDSNIHRTVNTGRDVVSHNNPFVPKVVEDVTVTPKAVPELRPDKSADTNKKDAK